MATKVVKIKDVVSVETYTDGFRVDIANKNAIVFLTSVGFPSIALLRVQHGMVGDLREALKEFDAPTDGNPATSS